MWCRVTTCPNKSRRWAWFRLGIRRLLHKFNNRPRFKRTTLPRVSLRCPVEKLCTSPANWQRRTSKALSISHNSFRHMLMHCLVDMQRRPRKPTAQIACVSTADSMLLTILNQLVIINKRGKLEQRTFPSLQYVHLNRSDHPQPPTHGTFWNREGPALRTDLPLLCPSCPAD